MTSKTIQTYEELNKIWLNVEYAHTWKELISNGWVFEYEEGGAVCMSRNGYLNLFRMGVGNE